MNRLLLLLENKRNRDLLGAWLSHQYQIVLGNDPASLRTPFDVCLVDGPALDRLGPAIQARKAEEAPTFLPVILLTAQREAELLTRHLWQSVDELIRLPVEKLELQARIEMLLRARRLSLDLKLRNEALEAMYHGIAHDVRAPLRAIHSFAQLVQEEEAGRLSPQGQHDLTQIQNVVTHMQDTVEGLINFARMEQGDLNLHSVSLDPLVARCLERLQTQIQQRQAQVNIPRPLPTVLGNSALLRLTFTNLLSNALKFVRPGVKPEISIQAAVAQQICRLEIEDNGIGIAPEDQERLFQPFGQLHGEEVYEGVGLGLATVRKAVELMGGRNGVISSPGKGSVFWLELRSAE